MLVFQFFKTNQSKIRTQKKRPKDRKKVFNVTTVNYKELKKQKNKYCEFLFLEKLHC